jgi:hypothetical protein
MALPNISANGNDLGLPPLGRSGFGDLEARIRFSFNRFLMNNWFRVLRLFSGADTLSTTLQVEWHAQAEGYYFLEVIDLAKEASVFSREIWMDAQAGLVELEIPGLPPGNYLLKASNKQSGQSHFEKMVVRFT